MNYIKLNLPPTICDLVKCQELIDRKRLSNEEKDEVLLTNKYDTPKKVKEYIESVLNKAGVQDFLKKKTDELILWKQTSYTQKEIKQLLKSKKI